MQNVLVTKVSALKQKEEICSTAAVSAIWLT